MVVTFTTFLVTSQACLPIGPIGKWTPHIPQQMAPSPPMSAGTSDAGGRKKREATVTLPVKDGSFKGCFKDEKECKSQKHVTCPEPQQNAYCEKSNKCAGDEAVGLFCLTKE